MAIIALTGFILSISLLACKLSRINPNKRSHKPRGPLQAYRKAKRRK